MNEGGSQEEIVVDPIKVSEDSFAEGTWTMEESGTVVIVWNNKYSWMTSKQVAYSAKVIKDGESPVKAPAPPKAPVIPFENDAAKIVGAEAEPTPAPAVEAEAEAAAAVEVEAEAAPAAAVEVEAGAAPAAAVEAETTPVPAAEVEAEAAPAAEAEVEAAPEAETTPVPADNTEAE